MGKPLSPRSSIASARSPSTFVVSLMSSTWMRRFTAAFQKGEFLVSARIPAMKLIECVPNFSEGRDRAVIDAIAAEIAGTAGVVLLDVDPGFATNRTVMTFIGAPEPVEEA